MEQAITVEVRRIFPHGPLFIFDAVDVPSVARWIERHYAIPAHHIARADQFFRYWTEYSWPRVADRTLGMLTRLWERLQAGHAVYRRFKLIDAVTDEIVRIFRNLGPFERELLHRFDNPLQLDAGFNSDYAWLEQHAGITQEEDDRWLDILMATYGSEEDVDAEDWTFVTDDSAVEAFLQELWERYRGCEPYPFDKVDPNVKTDF